MSEYQFAVITETTLLGNLATTFDLYEVKEGRSEENHYREQVELVEPLVMMGYRQPVFNVGEILILDSSGREVDYPGRKPSKWEVTYEVFDRLDEAVKRARAVFEQSLREQAAKDDS